MLANHSRTASEETTSTSMSYILEHVLQYPGSYEIPLRTMYTLNCVPRAQPLPKELSRSSTPSDNRSGSPVSVSGSLPWNDAEATTMNFTSQLMSHLNSLPTHQSSLPPKFIVKFVNNCFHPSLQLVDFPQALTALDYLRDLENRRHMEMIAALDRLQIRKETYATDIESMGEQFPGIALWIKNVEGKDRKAIHHYAQLWLGLRRWILINELSLQPFSKLNCVGMLNTLLPPMHPDGKTPSPLLTYQTLRDERETFFDYIRHVQKEGPSVLQPIIEMHKAPGDENGWPVVQRLVERYLRIAENMIDDCQSITGPECFNRATRSTAEPRKGKKTDSGVSFGSERSQSIGTVDHPMPESLAEPTPAPKTMSRLERITREFRRMRVKTRPDVEEIVKVDKQSAAYFVPPTGQNKGKTIKKARSMANIANSRDTRTGSPPFLPGGRNASDAVPFDAEQMKRHRKMYEASIHKNTKNVV